MDHRIQIYGASDDLVEIEQYYQNKETWSEEYGAYYSGTEEGMWDKLPINKVINLSQGSTRRLRIYCSYIGCWCFAVSKIEEEDPWPNWRIFIRQREDCEYSTELVIESVEKIDILVEECEEEE